MHASAQPVRARWIWGLGLVFALVGGLALPAVAQERYRLNENQWQKEKSYDPATPEGQIQLIRRDIAEDHAEQAIEAADAWIETHPNHPLLVEAYFLRGDAKSAAHDYYNALFDYEYVTRQYPGSEQFMTALEREYEIGRLYANGLKRKFLGMHILGATSEAEEIFIRIQERAPGSDIGEKASLALADHYFRQAEMDSAATAYDMFLINYPHSTHREYAMLRLIQANLAIFKGPTFDATGLLEAAQRLRMYEKEFPASAEQLGMDALLARIDESLALKGYAAAQWYQVRGEKVSAIYMYQRVVRDFPRTAAAQDAILHLTALGASTTPAGKGGSIGGVAALSATVATQPAAGAPTPVPSSGDKKK